jgi:hypothetical protein
METLPARPRWLDDEPEIVALLSSIIDRFEQQSGESRSQRIPVHVERYLPSLKRLDADADQLWHLVGSLQAHGILEIKPAKKSMLDAPWSGAKLAFSPNAEATLRHWLNRPAHPSELKTWRDLVSHHASAFPGDINVLMRRRLVIPGHTDHETIAALARISNFHEPITLRQLSAALFRGDSKLLDERADLVQSLFPDLQIRQRAIVVAVHLPVQIEGILFIENQESYTAGCEGGLPAVQNLALVYAAGFRGSAERIRDADGALLHYCGPGVERWHASIGSWWFTRCDWQPPLYFFGDLDFSGMRILAALRRRFGNVLAWQPGYAHLLACLVSEGGHTADAADKKLQSDPGRVGCSYADEVLLPAMRLHGFLDQEALIPGR